MSAGDEFQLPAWLVDLVRAERPDFAADAVTRQLRAARVLELMPKGDDPNRPDGIAYVQPDGIGGWVDVRYEEWEFPLATALTELANAVSRHALLERMHFAWTDLDLVRHAARELAVDAESRASAERKYAYIENVIELGIVCMYARAWTGTQRLPERWRPESEEDRELHEQILDLRNTLFAHSDRSPGRALININAERLEEPAIFAERRDPLRPAFLRRIADLCDRQYERFWLETGRLKHDIGSPAHVPPRPEE